MGMNYTLLAGILLYFFMLRQLDESYLTPVKAAGVVIGGYVGLSLVLKAIWLLGYHAPLWQLLSPSLFITALLQFVMLVVIFDKAENTGDSYMAYIGWGGLGLAVVFFIVPLIAQNIFMGL